MNISLAPETIFYIKSFPVTNTLLMAWLELIFLALVVLIVRLRLARIPARLQSFIELIIESLLNFMEGVAGSRQNAKRFFPLVATIFIFVLASNLVEIIPGLGTVGIWEEEHGSKLLIPFIRSNSADMNFTLALAILAVFAVQVFGVSSLGFFKYASRFINFKNPIYFFVGILELFAELAKIISFSFRLFGNIFAGEVLLLTMMFLLPFFGPIPFLFLEIFVGFVQALIFATLTLIFLKIATSAHEEGAAGH